MQLDTYFRQPETKSQILAKKLWPPDAGAVGLFEDIMIVRKSNV